MDELQVPDLKEGIEYWTRQPASVDGVLGGYGTGSLPRVDAMGSRKFLLYLLPELSIVPSTISRLNSQVHHCSRALDVGAGIGRVTSDVLLHLVSDVVLLEPVEPLVQEAFTRGQSAQWKGVADATKSVSFYQGTLQAFDPLNPQLSARFLGRVGRTLTVGDTDSRFDVIWCQWCLGYLSDPHLVAFLGRSRKALRDRRSLIVVKENLCSAPEGSVRTIYDPEDSSLLRSDSAFKKIFNDVGFVVVCEEVQAGFQAGLYAVKMYALKGWV